MQVMEGILQELLSNDSKSTMFFDKHWRRLGSRDDLSSSICRAIGMVSEPLDHFDRAYVTAKLSLGALLQARAPEDRVYAMSKVVGVSLEPRYGESEERAFRRFQEAIIDSLDDESLFVWDIQRENGRSTSLLTPNIDLFSRWSSVQVKKGLKRFSVRRDTQGCAQGIVFTGTPSSILDNTTRCIRLQCTAAVDSDGYLYLRRKDDNTWERDSMPADRPALRPRVGDGLTD